VKYFKSLPSFSLRTGKELVDNQDPKIFSDFELSEIFVQHIIKTNYNEDPFCFKDELPKALQKNDSEMAEFTRALHAEENALFQGLKNTGDNLEGAYLYTTDKTRTLCAKKALTTEFF